MYYVVVCVVVCCVRGLVLTIDVITIDGLNLFAKVFIARRINRGTSMALLLTLTL